MMQMKHNDTHIYYYIMGMQPELCIGWAEVDSSDDVTAMSICLFTVDGCVLQMYNSKWDFH